MTKFPLSGLVLTWRCQFHFCLEWWFQQ